MNIKQELQRKGIHQLALAIPIGYTFLSKSLSLQILISIAVIVTIVDFGRFKLPWLGKIFSRIFHTLLREHETYRYTGSTNLLWGSVLVIWLFPKNIVLLSLYFLIISDSAAALVGKLFGKHKIFDKSLEGTAAFFASATIITYFFPEFSLIQRISAAITAAIVELLPIPIDDNFLLPVATCSFMMLF